MSYNRYRHYDACDCSFFKVAGIVLLVGVVIGLITWGIVYAMRDRTFVAVLNSKDAPVTFTYDEESLSIDDEGNLEIDGEDETVAYKTYDLIFYVDGEVQTVHVDRFRGKTPNVKREDLALAELAAVDVEPAAWTHAKPGTEYLVKVASFGWLVDITPMSMVRVE